MTENHPAHSSPAPVTAFTFQAGTLLSAEAAAASLPAGSTASDIVTAVIMELLPDIHSAFELEATMATTAMGVARRAAADFTAAERSLHIASSWLEAQRSLRPADAELDELAAVLASWEN